MNYSTLLLASLALSTAVPQEEESFTNNHSLEKRSSKNYYCDKVFHWNNPALTRVKTWSCKSCVGGGWSKVCVPNVCTKVEMKNQAWWVRINGPDSIEGMAEEAVRNAAAACVAIAGGIGVFSGAAASIPTAGTGAVAAAASSFFATWMSCMTSKSIITAAVASQFSIGVPQANWWDGDKPDDIC